MVDAEDIVIGVDPHKASWTAAAVDRDHWVRGILRVTSTATSYRELRVFAAQWPGARWAIEGGTGLGRPLAHRLLDEHIDVMDVPAKLSARVRALGRGHGRKTDAADAVSTAIAARTTATLQRVSAASSQPKRCACSATAATIWLPLAPRRSTASTPPSPTSCPAAPRPR